MIWLVWQSVRSTCECVKTYFLARQDIVQESYCHDPGVGVGIGVVGGGGVRRQQYFRDCCRYRFLNITNWFNINKWPCIPSPITFDTFLPELWAFLDFLYPPPTSWGGYTGITLSVRPSVRPSVRLSVRRSVRPSVCPSVCPSICPGLSGTLLGHFSMNLPKTLYTCLSSYGIVHL